MKRFFYLLMTDKKRSFIYAPFKFVLFIISLGYGLGIFARALFYKYGIFKAERVPLKIISVGNLTLGGTGKTPFVIALVKMLKESLDKDASVLIRGYGWDEQTMLKKSMPDVPILVGSNRVESCHRSIRLYGSNTAILDDGFQYWDLERDLDIVLVDSRNPFGNGRLFPRGILREPLSAIKRADAVVFTKVNRAGKETIASLKALLKGRNPDLIFAEAVHMPKYLYDYKARKQRYLSSLGGKRVVLLSSIGDPEYFEETVRSLGANIVEHIIYPDHHNYTQNDAARILDRCSQRQFDTIVTTEKDMVKLQRMSLSLGNSDILTLVVEMEIVNGKEMLIDRLHSLYSR